jgi:hypothetical protein
MRVSFLDVFKFFGLVQQFKRLPLKGLSVSEIWNYLQSKKIFVGQAQFFQSFKYCGFHNTGVGECHQQRIDP